MRYYDPTAGEVLPDGHRMADLNLRSWRRFVGVVSQEPVLFDTSIASNIKYSRPGASSPDQQQQRIVLWQFVFTLWGNAEHFFLFLEIVVG